MRIFLTYILIIASFSGIAQGKIIPGKAHNHAKKLKTCTQNSVLATGTWYKMAVEKEGIYKISYNDLEQMGINVSSIDPRNICIYGNGNGMLPENNAVPCCDDLIENAIYVSSGNNSTFGASDYILFYGESPVVWSFDTVHNIFTHTINFYSNETCYFLTIGNSPGKRIQLQNSVKSTPNIIVAKYNDYQYHELDTINLIQSGKEWYGECFNAVTSYTFNFNFPNIDVTSPVKIISNIAAANTIPTCFYTSSNGKLDSLIVAAVPGQTNTQFANTNEDTLVFNPSGQNIQLTISKITPSSVGWLDFIDVNAISNLNFNSPQMCFRNLSSTGNGNISRFLMNNANPSVQVWDISDPFNIKLQQDSLNGTTLSYIVSTDSLKQFIAFDGSSFLTPVFEGQVPNQNLHGLPQPDFIIVSNPDFIQQANRLAAIHATHDNFNVVVVTPQQIYNEFSSGVQDVSAIRNFLRMFYNRANSALNNFPKYLLMFGDGSYDYKNHLTVNTNLVPTYESFNSLTPTACYGTDDFFGILDSTGGYYCNGNIDVGVGRFPVLTTSEAETMVDKVEDYIYKKSSYTEKNGCTTFTKNISGDWQNIVCFIADDGDNNLHLGQVEALTAYADTANLNLNIQKIYLDAYVEVTNSNGVSYPTVNKAIDDRVENGALIINYTGHGGPTGWAAAKVLQQSDINSWTNITNMPIFYTASCEFSPFDNPGEISAGEQIVLNPNGGGIAVFSTTRVAFSNTNFNLDQSFYKYALQRFNGQYYHLGDLIKLAKNDNGDIVNDRIFVLLGDPALTMSYPGYKVITTEINGLPAQSQVDTIRPLSKVTVSGIIQDNNGDTLKNFNGRIYPTIYDKKYITRTLGNNSTSIPVNFYQQEHILYKGIDTVINGKFTFTFVPSKDMLQNYGMGKISYYAKMDSTHDATGYYENPDFIFGGIDSGSTTGLTGPRIQLYMNNTSFISGGTTTNNPLLLAFLEDPCGINYNSCNYGHDITAVLDSNTAQSIVLDDYYSPNINTYNSGSILYPFVNLSYGKHTLMLKAWDENNISGEASTEFVVSNPSGLSLNNIYNYPNPFTDNTYFIFKNNQPCCDLNVVINIYSLIGMPVATIQQTVSTEGSSIAPIEWDGSNNNGEKLSSGTYLYHVTVTTSGGSYIESSNKLIIVR